MGFAGSAPQFWCLKVAWRSPSGCHCLGLGLGLSGSHEIMPSAPECTIAPVWEESVLQAPHHLVLFRLHVADVVFDESFCSWN